MSITANPNGEVVGWDLNMGETIEFYEQLYKCKIHLHGKPVGEGLVGERIVTVYQTPNTSYQAKLPDRVSGMIEDITLPVYGRNMWVNGDVKRNWQRASINRNKIARCYCVANEDLAVTGEARVVAEVDTAGGIHFMDFYQGMSGGRSFDPVFRFIMEHHGGRSGKSLYRTFEGTLDRLNCEVIKEVKIVTEFDAELFKKECTMTLERAVEYQKSINESKSRSLQRTLDEEREGAGTAKRRASHTGFKLGLMYGRGKGYHGWTYDSDETSPWHRWLCFYKPIEVVELHYHGKKVMVKDVPEIQGKFIVNGLRVLPTQSRVFPDSVRVDESTYHPNASNGQLCIGDLEGRNLPDVLEKLPYTLRIGNFDSALRAGLTEKWKHLWYKTTKSPSGLEELKRVELDKTLADTHIWEVA